MTRRTNHSKVPTCVFATFALLISALASDAQTVRYQDGFASGISNLRINNLCYDVEFVDGSYQSVFADQPPAFLNQPEAADAAADRIGDVLNDQRRTPEINESENEVLWIPNDRVTRSTFQAAQVGHNKSDDPWIRFGDFQGNVSTDFEAWDYARFTEGPVVVYAANTEHAVGINNLNLDGTCVDVRFAKGSYEEIYEDNSPRYLGLELRADYAADRIMDVLNAEANVPEINDSPNELIWLPTDRTKARFEAEQVGHNDSASPWQRFADFSGSSSHSWDAWDFAVFDQSLDCNRDGMVNIQDMNCACGVGDLSDAILTAIDTKPGDLDGNGNVSFADFLTLSANFGNEGMYTDGDLNCDGQVGFADFLIMSDNYGYGQIQLIPELQLMEVAPVPEPNHQALVWALVPAILLGIRRQR